MHWKTKIYESAYKVANRFTNDPNVIGVALGGSIGRGMTWKHSDLELCIIVEKRTNEYQYFNFMDNLGVEIIQIQKELVEDFVTNFREPNAAILKFPIQIYKCRVIHDPTGILAKFKDLYDRYLFHKDITHSKKAEALAHADKKLVKAKEILSIGHHKTAVAHLRVGLNYLLLAYYWHHNILPRSQNRTIYMLKKNTKIIGHEKLYDAFINIFCLNKSYKMMRENLFRARSDILKISATNWGSGASDFLENAVDSKLEWGHGQSILYVYKYCLHRMQCRDDDQEGIYDQETFKFEYEHINEFLDFGDMEPEKVNNMVKLFGKARERI
jgi:predicted nucleotidyltransferase